MATLEKKKHERKIKAKRCVGIRKRLRYITMKGDANRKDGCEEYQKAVCVSGIERQKKRGGGNRD